jgi:triphosphoribosyl-dephospho-CoA synthase
MSIGFRVQRAIELECTAVKVGNVHPGASFHDLQHHQFMTAAQTIGASMERNASQPVGKIVLQAVQSMMESVGTNTSLGTILLIAPLVASTHLPNSVGQVLRSMTPADASDIYEAIRIAKPGGLGDVESMDVRYDSPDSILDAMKVASEWDDIALQYVTDFELVFTISNRLVELQRHGLQILDAIRCVQIELLSERLDSLIARKKGRDFAIEAQSRSRSVRAAGPYGSSEYESQWSLLDRFLRDDEHGGNPGTIADLIAAACFQALRI